MSTAFKPHQKCTFAKDECADQSKCLGRCRSHNRKTHEQRLIDLERRVEMLEIKARTK